MVAQGLEALDRTAHRAAAVARIEPVGSQVLVHDAVAQQVVEDHQDGVGRSDGGATLATLDPASASGNRPPWVARKRNPGPSW